MYFGLIWLGPAWSGPVRSGPVQPGPVRSGLFVIFFWIFGIFQKIEFLAYLVVPGMLGPFQIDRACKNTPGVLFSAPELDSGKKLKIQKNRFYEKVPHGLPMGSPWAPMESPWVKSQKSKVTSQKSKAKS